MYYLFMLINPIITEVSSIDKRKLCKLSLNHEVLGKLEVKTYLQGESSDMFNIDVVNSDKLLIGREILGIEDRKKGIFGFNINVERKYRNNFVGELLRLVSIIELFENNKEEIEIASKPSAIYFHSKYKFEPDIRMFSSRDNALMSCIKNECSDMVKERAEAITIMEKIKQLKTPEENRNFCKIVNEFIKKYITKVLSLSKERQVFYPFDYGFNMKLLKTSILENAKFFNEMYRKHGINYKI